MKKIKVTLTVEVFIDADKQTVQHFDATGEVWESMRYSIERAEIKAQEALDRHAKRLCAVVGADYGSARVEEKI